jgi:hypothetical protein
MESFHASRNFLVASSAVLLFSSGLFHHLGYRILPPDSPPEHNADVARSVWRALSLQPPEFVAFKEQLSRLSRERHEGYDQDVFSLGKGGQVFPKHSVISGVIGAPFYGLFGECGFWILQQLLALILFYSTYRVTSLLAKRDTGVATLLSVALLTQTLIGFFCYVYSYDLHGLVLLVWGLHLMYSWPLLGSTLATLSVFVRPSYALTVPFLLCAWRGAPRHTSHLRDVVLGAGGVLCLYFLVNHLMWGGPLVTSYDRVAAFGPDGNIFIEHHPRGFNMSVFLSDWWRKLFGFRVGLMTFNPALIALPWVCAWAWHSEQRSFALTTLAGSVVCGLYMFSYEQWDVSYVGNRFLLPSVYLYLLSFIPWFSGVLGSVGEARGDSKPAELG